MPRATALLRNGSAAVVEEAAATLAPSAAQLPADLLWDLLTDPQRPAVRRAGHRLLTRRDRLTALRAALLPGGDTDPRLAARGTADATARIRELAPHPWLTRPPPTLDADPRRRPRPGRRTAHPGAGTPHRPHRGRDPATARRPPPDHQ
ncbi:hypothetical protein [Kitasatospora sp. NPDC048407]|uniref:hypothetical protein n=1 Tax=Kitasatospora sp. NPDC048407 TaxID=3364051 RepID=UPI0037146AC3